MISHLKNTPRCITKFSMLNAKANTSIKNVLLRNASEGRVRKREETHLHLQVVTIAVLPLATVFPVEITPATTLPQVGDHMILRAPTVAPVPATTSSPKPFIHLKTVQNNGSMM